MPMEPLGESWEATKEASSKENLYSVLKPSSGRPKTCRASERRHTVAAGHTLEGEAL